MLDANEVGMWVDSVKTYCKTTPFDPSEDLPEFPGIAKSPEDNPAFRGIRQSFVMLGYDRRNVGTAFWNPLSWLVRPGDTVVLKPNLVTHFNHGTKLYGITDTDSLLTHGSIIRCVLEYVGKALDGTGKVIVGDCPLQGTDWDAMMRVMQFDAVLDAVRARYPKTKFVLKDYRLAVAVFRGGQVVERRETTQSADDYTEVDLKNHSLLRPLMIEGYQFGVVQYPRRRMIAAHSPSTNKYLVPNDFLYADVVINLPKMKNHMKAGITCALKNFVGINGHKDYLPHFRYGSPKNGGDEYPDGGFLWDFMWWFAHMDWDRDRGIAKRVFGLARRILGRIQIHLLRKPIDFASVGGGGWSGNDTLWRTILDINRAFFYFDRAIGEVSRNQGSDGSFPRYLAILDGVVGGEKESPLAPTPRACGVVAVAENPVALDAVACALMGFDHSKLKQVAKAFTIDTLPLVNYAAEDIVVCSNVGEFTLSGLYEAAFLGRPFVPSQGYMDVVGQKR